MVKRQGKSLKNAPVAQLDRVPGYELGGREFESLRARHTRQDEVETPRIAPQGNESPGGPDEELKFGVL
jgi:hypothetical protein